MRSSASQYSNIAASLSISHVSGVDSCSGMISREIKNAFDMRVPARMPHVSRLAAVLGAARERNWVRRSGEMKIVRRGVPFSR